MDNHGITWGWPAIDLLKCPCFWGMHIPNGFQVSTHGRQMGTEMVCSWACRTHKRIHPVNNAIDIQLRSIGFSSSPWTSWTRRFGVCVFSHSPQPCFLLFDASCVETRMNLGPMVPQLMMATWFQDRRWVRMASVGPGVRNSFIFWSHVDPRYILDISKIYPRYCTWLCNIV